MYALIDNECPQIQKIYNQRTVMKSSLRPVLLLLTYINIISLTHTKDLLLHTIQYRLSPERLLTMATVNFNNDLLSAFMILEPEVQLSSTYNHNSTPLVSQAQIQHNKNAHMAEIKRIAKTQFHTKLTHPIKLLIHNQDQIEQQCLFHEPSDLCMIDNPSKKKSLDFSIHCLLQKSSPGNTSGSCNGKLTIRQSNLTKIVTDDRVYQEKTKYRSGLFEIPQSNRHSVMLITCQDDDLPQFTDSLKIYSNSKYHRYDRQNSEEIKELIGFDKGITGKKQQNNPVQNSQAKSGDPSSQLRSQEGRRFFYLDVRDQMVRKCLQFEFYSSSDLINERKVFDFVNLTDTEYKNLYRVVRRQFKAQNTKDAQQSKNPVQVVANPQPQPLFKYNPQLTLDIFEPQISVKSTAFDMRIKLIDTLIQSTVVSYKFPLTVNNESALLSSTLYSKSNHYHFCFVVGQQIVKGLSHMEVQLEFEASGAKADQISQKQQFFFVTLSVEDVQNVKVEKLATTYLAVKKGEHITFLLQEPYEIDEIKTQTNAKPNDLVQILPSSPTHMQISLSEHSSDHQHTTECHFSKGCKFQLDLLKECLDCKIQYKTSFIRSPHDMLMLEIKQTIFQGKIDLDQIQYFYKELKPLEILQLIINTPNIIIYTLQNQSDQEKCKVPKKSCHNQVATSHQRIILSNQDKSRSRLVFFAIEGLDKTRFSLLLVTSDKIINVMNGIPFTYKLPAQMNQIELLFEVPAFDDGKPYENNLTFNLISPLNSLEMDIIQIKEDTNEQEAVQKSKTMSGYIKLSSKNVKFRKIKIILAKTALYLSNSVHFTFIASTSDHKFRLDTGITHYQTLDSAEQKTFVIEFQDQHTYELNLHLYDAHQKQIAFTVSVFNPNEASEGKKALNYKVSSKEWALVLDDELVDGQDLCPQNDPECTLFVTVASMMAHEVEMAMTLMTQDSVMELKDGVWQTFKLDDLLMRAHFYFTPTHSSNPVKIFFKSSDPQIFISASLYDNSQNVNPAEWPFPPTHGHSQEDNFQTNQNNMFKSNHLIQIDNEDPQFLKCFPQCVVLMSVIQSEDGRRYKKQAINSQPEIKLPSDTLSLLASNNHIELPQKMRLTLELKASQQQLVYIDLKHAFNQRRQVLTFFCNMIVGYAQVYGKVYLPSLQNIPDEEDYDVLFGPVKTQVSLAEIRDVFMQSLAWMVDVQSVEEILEKEELFLVLFVVAKEPTQMTLEYTTDYDEITELSIDSVETVALESNQQKIFQFYPTRDQKIRFIRNKGYPLFHQFKCEAQQGGFDSCLKGWLQRLRLKTEDDIRNIRREREVEKELTETPKITDKNMVQMAALSQQQQFSQYQILKKTQTQHVLECQRCIVFIWIFGMEESELTIQLQSLTTETLLKENEILADYVEPNEYHRYYLGRVKKEFTTVVVAVNEGNPLVTVADNLNFEQTRKASQVKDEGKKVLIFSVPPVQELLDKTHPSKKSSFNTIFSNLHITITPEDAKPVSYTISYSSGMHEMFLKNGVISTQYFFADENATFYYKNENKQRKSYLTLTVEAPTDQMETVLRGIEIKMFSLTMDPSKGVLKKDELAAEQPSTAGAKFRKHTTLTYEIPPVDDLQIDIFSSTTTKVTIGLTGGQLVFLPMDYEYPIYLQPHEEIKFLVENLDPSQDIEFILKKCDQSDPFIFYTLEEAEYQNDRFNNYDRFGSNSVFRHVTRALANKALYIKLKADPKETSTLVIKSSYILAGDRNFVDLDPGNMGLVQYQFQSLNEVAVKFEGLQCGKDCVELTEYFVVRSKSFDVLYKQMVCAGEAFIKLFEKKQVKTQNKPATVKNRKPQPVQQNTNDPYPSPMVSPLTERIKFQRILTKPSNSNRFELLVAHEAGLPVLTIKAVYKPSGEQTYYKPTEIKNLQSSVQSYSPKLVAGFAGLILLGMIGLIVVTQKLARRGYVHVGQEETMVV